MQPDISARLSVPIASELRFSQSRHCRAHRGLRRMEIHPNGNCGKQHRQILRYLKRFIVGGTARLSRREDDSIWLTPDCHPDRQSQQLIPFRARAPLLVGFLNGSQEIFIAPERPFNYFHQQDRTQEGYQCQLLAKSWLGRAKCSGGDEKQQPRLQCCCRAADFVAPAHLFTFGLVCTALKYDSILFRLIVGMWESMPRAAAAPGGSESNQSPVKQLMC